MLCFLFVNSMCITHNLEESLIGDKILMLDSGQIKFNESVKKVYDEALLNGCTMWNAMDALINRPGSPANDALKEDLQEFMKLIEDQRQKLLSGRGLSAKVRQMVEDIVAHYSMLIYE